MAIETIFIEIGINKETPLECIEALMPLEMINAKLFPLKYSKNSIS